MNSEAARRSIESKHPLYYLKVENMLIIVINIDLALKLNWITQSNLVKTILQPTNLYLFHQNYRCLCYIQSLKNSPITVLKWFLCNLFVLIHVSIALDWIQFGIDSNISKTFICSDAKIFKVHFTRIGEFHDNYAAIRTSLPHFWVLFWIMPNTLFVGSIKVLRSFVYLVMI